MSLLLHCLVKVKGSSTALVKYWSSRAQSRAASGSWCMTLWLLRRQTLSLAEILVTAGNVQTLSWQGAGGHHCVWPHFPFSEVATGVALLFTDFSIHWCHLGQLICACPVFLIKKKKWHLSSRNDPSRKSQLGQTHTLLNSVDVLQWTLTTDLCRKSMGLQRTAFQNRPARVG